MAPGGRLRTKAWLTYAVLLLAVRLAGRRRISAMVRVRNEEEFLLPAVESIIDSVDEVVLVDNASRDGSPTLIAGLQRQHGAKIAAFAYPYEIRRVGREHEELASRQHGNSPHLSSNYYNWCLQRCRHPYVLKWDADMIATPAWSLALAEWRRTRRPILEIHGANVYPDYRHLAAARCTDRSALQAKLGSTVPAWVASMTYDFPEPRLFPRLGARYDDRLGWTQSLSSPFYDARFGARLRYRPEAACYLHMKFCKRDPCSNYSPELAGVIGSNLCVGPPLPDEAVGVLQRWRIGPGGA